MNAHVFHPSRKNPHRCATCGCYVNGAGHYRSDEINPAKTLLETPSFPAQSFDVDGVSDKWAFQLQVGDTIQLPIDAPPLKLAVITNVITSPHNVTIETPQVNTRAFVTIQAVTSYLLIVSMVFDGWNVFLWDDIAWKLHPDHADIYGAPIVWSAK